MKNLVLIILTIFMFSCAENLLEKPENLIPEAKMIEILNDLAILNAAKTTNVSILRKYEIEPMPFIFEKYSIDSLQFVESDRYYASIPEAHEKIYIAVEEKLEKEKERLAEEKKVQDSLDLIKRELERKNEKLKINDSLLKKDDKQTKL